MIAGGTSSSNFPVTPDAFQPAYRRGALPAASLPGDGFFSHLSPNLDQLLYSTYVGGSDSDSLLAMGLDLANNAYLAGVSYSSLQTPGSYSFGGPGLLWALKIANDTSLPPSILSVSPTTLTAGSGDSPIQLIGTNFARDAVVLLNGVNLATTFQSSTQLTAIVSAASLAITGSLALRVLNPASGASNLLLLPVVAAAGNNPSPRIQELLPSGLTAGSPGQNIEVTGTGFISSTMAAVNGSPRATSPGVDNTLSVALMSTDLSSPGTLSLTLTNPAPGGGTSGVSAFLVAPGLVPLPPPGLSSISPSSAPSGTGTTTISFTASGLSSSTVVRWNGADHTISSTNTGGFTFTLSAADLANAGTAEVTVYDYGTGLESNPLPFWLPYAGTFTDMAWNSANARIYLSGTNSLIILNPETGEVDATIPVDIAISRLEVSPEGSYLYAATADGTLLRNCQLLSGAPWLGTSVDLSLNGLADFAPVPGSPGSVAVYVYNGFQGEIAVYDGAVKRPGTANLPNGGPTRALVFSADGQTLYYAVGYSSVAVSTMPVTANGIGAAVTKGSPSDATIPATFFQGRIYTSSGAVFDATSLARVGTVPDSSYALPLVSSQAIVMLDGTSQSSCSLQAFDPVTLLPMWEEHAGGACANSFILYSKLFDIGGSIAFRMTNAYIVKKPTLTAQDSIYSIDNPLTATVEVGTNWNPLNELAVQSQPNTLPVTAFLLPDQPGFLTLGPAYLYSQYFVAATPGYFSFGPVNSPIPVGTYTSKVPLLISNSTNPPLVASYNISVVNPYPMQASVSSLAFTWNPDGLLQRRNRSL